jgi:hypothetical protein
LSRGPSLLSLSCWLEEEEGGEAEGEEGEEAEGGREEKPLEEER